MSRRLADTSHNDIGLVHRLFQLGYHDRKNNDPARKPQKAQFLKRFLPPGSVYHVQAWEGTGVEGGFVTWEVTVSVGAPLSEEQIWGICKRVGEKIHFKRARRNIYVYPAADYLEWLRVWKACGLERAGSVQTGSLSCVERSLKKVAGVKLAGRVLKVENMSHDSDGNRSGVNRKKRS